MRKLSVAALILVFAVRCGETGSWPAADAFRSRLHCGMSPAEVASLGRQYGARRFEENHSPRHWSTHFLRERGTVFWFTFPGGKLAVVQEGQYYGVTGMRMSARQDLCSGTTLAEPGGH